MADLTDLPNLIELQTNCPTGAGWLAGISWLCDKIDDLDPNAVQAVLQDFAQVLQVKCDEIDANLATITQLETAIEVLAERVQELEDA